MSADDERAGELEAIDSSEPGKSDQTSTLDETMSGNAYTVGYGKPPRSGQFQPGRSGNPRGRRKGDRTLKATLRTVMGERITVHTGKGPKRLTKMEAFTQRVTNGALSGDAAATRQLISMIQMAGLQSDLGEALDSNQAARMMADDQAILDRHLGRNASAGLEGAEVTVRCSPAPDHDRAGMGTGMGGVDPADADESAVDVSSDPSRNAMADEDT